MLIMAETESRLAQHADAKQQLTAAQKSLEWTDKASALNVESRSLHRRRAGYLTLVGKQDEAQQAFKKAESVTPSTALDFYLLGQEQRHARKFEEALRLYQKALQINPDYFWAMQNSGLCNLKLGRFDAAVASYTACIADRPKERICYLTRAVAYAELKQYGSALEDFDTAVRLDPDMFGIYLNRGAVQLAQKRYDEAIADFNRAAKMRPDRAGPHINLGETYRLQADDVRQKEGLLIAAPIFQKALGELTKAAELAPNSARLYRMRGDINLRLEATETARQDFLKSIELETSPRFVSESYKQIGLIAHRDEEFPQALEAYDKAINFNSQDAVLHRLRGEVLLTLDRDKEAIPSFNKFLELERPALNNKDSVKHFADVYRALGTARAKLGKYHDAFNDYTRALELEPETPVMFTRRGWAYLLRANSLALKDFEQAVKLNPQNADSYIGRGYAKVMLGDYAAAVADAELAIPWALKQAKAQGAKTWPLFYNTATIYVQAVLRVEKDIKRKPEDREKLAQQFTQRALQLIGQAFRVGGAMNQLALLRTLQTDTALDPIRTRKEFQQIFKPPTPKNKKPQPKPTKAPKKS